MLEVIKGLPETYTKVYWRRDFNKYPGCIGRKGVSFDLKSWLDPKEYTSLMNWWSFPTASIHCAYTVINNGEEEYWTVEFLRPDLQFAFRNIKFTDLIKEVKEFINMCCKPTEQKVKQGTKSAKEVMEITNKSISDFDIVSCCEGIINNINSQMLKDAKLGHKKGEYSILAAHSSRCGGFSWKFSPYLRQVREYIMNHYIKLGYKLEFTEDILWISWE